MNTYFEYYLVNVPGRLPSQADAVVAVKRHMKATTLQEAEQLCDEPCMFCGSFVSTDVCHDCAMKHNIPIIKTDSWFSLLSTKQVYYVRAQGNAIGKFTQEAAALYIPDYTEVPPSGKYEVTFKFDKLTAETSVTITVHVQNAADEEDALFIGKHAAAYLVTDLYKQFKEFPTFVGIKEVK